MYKMPQAYILEFRTIKLISKVRGDTDKLQFRYVWTYSRGGATYHRVTQLFPHKRIALSGQSGHSGKNCDNTSTTLGRRSWVTITGTLWWQKLKNTSGYNGCSVEWLCFSILNCSNFWKYIMGGCFEKKMPLIKIFFTQVKVFFL